MKRLFVSAMVLALTSLVSAVTIVVDGVDMDSSAVSGLAPTSITIPGTIDLPTLAHNGMNQANLRTVIFAEGTTSVPDKALFGCQGVTKVGIPASVTTIGSSAFYGCSNLKDVAIPPCAIPLSTTFSSGYTGFTNVVLIGDWKSIPASMFSGCSALQRVNYPSTVTNIGASAFYNCAKLKEVIFPVGLRRIADSTCYGCSALTSLSIPNTVTNIGANAFYGCTGVCDITIPPCVGDSVSPGRTSLTNAVLFGDWKSIPAGMFSGCTALQRVNYPSTVTNIGASAFYNCSKLKEVIFPEGMDQIADSTCYGCASLTSVVLPDAVKVIPSYAFYGCAALTNLVHSSDLTSVGDYAFYGTALDWFYLPEGLTNIDATHYQRIYGATKLVVPEGVTNIADYAFSGCTNLVEVVIPKSVVSIGQGAFSGCGKLKKMTLPFVGRCRGNRDTSEANFGYIFGTSSYVGSVAATQYNSETYYIPSTLVDVTITDETIFASAAFSGCSMIRDLSVPGTLTAISGRTFYGCSGLAELILPESVKTIPEYAFNSCTALTNLVCSSDIGSTGAYALSGTKVDKFLLSENATEISAYQYQNMYGLTRVVIPETVTNIGNYAFSGCTNLVKVVFGGRERNIASYAFSNCSKLPEINVPNSVRIIQEYAFTGCSSLTNMVLPFVGRQRGNDNSREAVFGYIFGTTSYPGGVRVLQNYSEGYWNSSSSYYSYNYIPKCLKSVTIADESVLAVGAFSHCSGIKRLNLESGALAIRPYAFGACSGVKELRLSPLTHRIDANAFYCCSSLPEIEIPVSVTNIASGALYGCGALERLTIPFIGSRRGNRNSSDALFGHIFGTTSFAGAAQAFQHATSSWSTYYYVPTNLTEVVVSDENYLNLGAFENCANLQKVVLPHTITNEAPIAFRNCSALRSFTLPDGMSVIGTNMFENCVSFKQIAIPEGVTRIGRQAFSRCCSLESLSFPSTLFHIGNEVFYCCESLKEVTLPNMLGEIPSGLFKECEGIENISLGSGVTNINSSAFYNCSNLVSVAIPQGMRLIGEKAFARCVKLGDLVIPQSVEQISPWAFSDCTALTNLVFEDGTQLIGDCAFSNCVSLLEVKWPETLCSIRPGAFVDCKKLNSPVLPGSIVYIGSSTFKNCQNLTNPILGGKLLSIGDEAFKDCFAIDNVVIPTNVQTIGKSVYSGCAAITNMVVPFIGRSRNAGDGVESVLGYFFGDSNFAGSYAATQFYQYSTSYHYACLGSVVYYLPSYLRTVYVSDAIKIYDGAFSGCRNLLSVELNEGIDAIGKRAFYDCWQLSEISLPSTLVSIEGYGSDYFSYTSSYYDTRIFGGMSSIRSVSMPSGLNIVSNMFSSFSSITNLTLTENSVKIRENEYGGCTGLSRFVVPKNVQTIGNSAFSGCSSLTNVTYEGSAPIVAGMDIYKGTPGDLTSWVTKGSTGWDGYTTSTALPATGFWPVSITSSRRIAFANAAPEEGEAVVDGTNVTLPEGCTNVVLAAMVGATVYELPEGMTWDAETGTLSGTAAASGSYDLFFVKDGKVQRYALNVTVQEKPNRGYAFTCGVETNLVVKGVVGCDVYGLPKGFVWDAGTATLAGAPSVVGTNTVYFVRGYGEETETFSTTFYVVGAGEVLPEPEPEPEPGEEKTEYAVSATVDLEGGAKGTASVSAITVAVGDAVTLTARAANAKSLFAYWRDAAGSILGYSARLTTIPTNDTDYVAVFHAMSACATPTFPAEMVEAVATNAMVGVQFKTQVTVNPEAYPVRFVATSLPNGLSIDTTTGEIKGVPVKAGTYSVAVRAISRANLSKTCRTTVRIRVLPLPMWARGTFNGVVSESHEDAELRGSATLTIGTTGRISGKFLYQGTNWTFNATGYDLASTFSGGDTNLVLKGTAKSGKVTRSVSLICAAGETLANASLLRGTMGDSEVALARNVWKDAGMTANLKSFAGLYTVQLLGDGTCGHGYLSLKLATTGTVKATGKLADGTAVSLTLPLLWDEVQQEPSAILFTAPTTYKGGFAYEEIRFGTDRRISGTGGFWQSHAPAATVEYGQGFDRTFTTRGAWYNTTASLRNYYETLAFTAVAPELATTVKETDLNETGKKVTTSVTEWQSAVELACWDSLSVSVNSKGTAFLVPKATRPVQDKKTKEWSYNGTNDAALSFKFTKATGLFTGTFTLWYDTVSKRDLTTGSETLSHTSKKVSYSGIAVQGEESLRGFYQWQTKGVYEDDKTGREKIYTYSESFPVEFK